MSASYPVMSSASASSSSTSNPFYTASEQSLIPTPGGSAFVNAGVSYTGMQRPWDMHYGRRYGEFDPMAIAGPLGYVTTPMPSTTTHAMRPFVQYTALSDRETNSMNWVNPYQWGGLNQPGFTWW